MIYTNLWGHFPFILNKSPHFHFSLDSTSFVARVACVYLTEREKMEPERELGKAICLMC